MSAAPARHPRMRRESEPFVTLLSQVEMQPPESDSYCKSLRAVHHLNQPPGWSIKPPGRASPPAGTEGDTCALLDRAGLEQRAWRAPARHTTLTTTEPRWLLRSRRQRVGCIISRLRCRVARLVQFRRFFLKRLRHAPKSTRQYHTDRTAWVSAHVIFRPQPGWSHMSAESAKDQRRGLELVAPWPEWPYSPLSHGVL